MFEIESRKNGEIAIVTKKTEIIFDVAESEIEAGLKVGKIKGPGEFEIGDVVVRGIDVGDNQTIYEAEVAGVKVGIIDGVEKGLDDLGVADILCTSSVRAVREINPKMVVATANIDGMVTELKLSVRNEKKLKIKNADSLPLAMEVVALI